MAASGDWAGVMFQKEGLFIIYLYVRLSLYYLFIYLFIFIIDLINIGGQYMVSDSE